MPNPDTESEAYIQFVDKVISAEVPRDGSDPELEALVRMYQMHSHTFTCKYTASATAHSTPAGTPADNQVRRNPVNTTVRREVDDGLSPIQRHQRKICRFG